MVGILNIFLYFIIAYYNYTSMQNENFCLPIVCGQVTSANFGLLN
jgi:hypothetical protein